MKPATPGSPPRKAAIRAQRGYFPTSTYAAFPRPCREVRPPPEQETAQSKRQVRARRAAGPGCSSFSITHPCVKFGVLTCITARCITFLQMLTQEPFQALQIQSLGGEKMARYQVVLTCEDDEVHLTRGTRVEEDQIAPKKLQLWLELGAI